MSVMASQITGNSIACSTDFDITSNKTLYLRVTCPLCRESTDDQVSSLHKGLVMWKTFPLRDVPLHDVIMENTRRFGFFLAELI